MTNDELFRGQIEAVQSQFDKSISTYDSIIDQAVEEQKSILLRKKEKDGNKRELDYDFKASHYRLLTAQKQKDDLLVKMGQFAKNDDRWDSEEAVYVILMSVFQIAEKCLSPTQFKKLEKGLNELKNKTVKELKELVTN